MSESLQNNVPDARIDWVPLLSHATSLLTELCVRRSSGLESVYGFLELQMHFNHTYLYIHRLHLSYYNMGEFYYVLSSNIFTRIFPSDLL